MSSLSEFTTASIFRRRQILVEALAKVLDRGPEMSVEATGPASSDLGVYVIAHPFEDRRVCHDLDRLASEMEVLLS